MGKKLKMLISMMLVCAMMSGIMVSAQAIDASQAEQLAMYYEALGDKENAALYRNLIQDTQVYQQIMALQALYPEGSKWDESNVYKTISKGRGNSGVVSACQAFAYLVQDNVFGKKKVSYKRTGLVSAVIGQGSYQITLNYYPETDDYGCWEISGYDGNNAKANQKFEALYAALRVGDIIADSSHMVVVLSKDANGVTVVEGNRGGQVHWGRRILKESLRRGMEAVETVY